HQRHVEQGLGAPVPERQVAGLELGPQPVQVRRRPAAEVAFGDDRRVGKRGHKRTSNRKRYKRPCCNRPICRSDEDEVKNQSAGPLGRRTVKVVPRPSLLVAATLPCIAWVRCLTMDRPSPVPPISRERALSTR